jgi:hypothetical protein
LEPFDTVRIGDSDVLYIGVEDGFVNKEDFGKWKQAFKKWLSETYDKKGARFAKMHSDLVAWAIGMLWPDQSYTSLRTYRNQHSKGWANVEFHAARFRMYTGELILLFFYWIKLFVFYIR